MHGGSSSWTSPAITPTIPDVPIPLCITNKYGSKHPGIRAGIKFPANVQRHDHEEQREAGWVEKRKLRCQPMATPGPTVESVAALPVGGAAMPAAAS